MSLFENEEYQWRETFFILFRPDDLPQADKVQRSLQQLDPRFVVRDVRADEQGRLESLTLESPDDYSAMDISLVKGDEVTEQLDEIKSELLKNAVSATEKQRVRELAQFTCRFDIYHFEQLVFVGRTDEDDEDADDFFRSRRCLDGDAEDRSTVPRCRGRPASEYIALVGFRCCPPCSRKKSRTVR
jgi:hypothetical protein